MPDATYVGAGMPCGNCGNPLTPGQPHKCGRTPDQPRDDGTHGTRWLAGKLPPDKEVVLAHHYDALRAAVSPDERLREALAFYADKGNYTAQNPVGSGAHVWRDMGGRARAALAAADREKPDKPHTQDCQDAMFMHHAATGGDMECTCRPPVSDDPKETTT